MGHTDTPVHAKKGMSHEPVPVLCLMETLSVKKSGYHQAVKPDNSMGSSSSPSPPPPPPPHSFSSFSSSYSSSVVLRFELKVSHALPFEPHCQPFFVLGIFETGSLELFARAGFEL
jgi:hypothetical protein